MGNKESVRECESEGEGGRERGERERERGWISMNWDMTTVRVIKLLCRPLVRFHIESYVKKN